LESKKKRLAPIKNMTLKGLAYGPFVCVLVSKNVSMGLAPHLMKHLFVLSHLLWPLGAQQ